MNTDPQFSKHTIYLREGDMAFLRDHYPRHGASNIIRRLVSKFVDDLDVVDSVQVEQLMAEESIDE